VSLAPMHLKESLHETDRRVWAWIDCLHDLAVSLAREQSEEVVSFAGD